VATRVIAFDVNETLVRSDAPGRVRRRDYRLLCRLHSRAARCGGCALAAPCWRSPARCAVESPQDVERAQLAHAGLTDRFDAILSADTVRALKPRREPYELTARRFGVPISDVTLVAAHAWDVAGALAAGCRAAFVAGRACRAIQSTGSRTCLAPTSARSPIGFSVLERGARNARAVVSCARMGTQRDGRCGGGNGCSRTPARAVRPRITRRDGCERDLHSGYRKDRWPST
jgi:hypothetical protein